MTLTEFLLTRLTEDEALAREFAACEWAGCDAWGDGTDLFFGDLAPASVERVLADCEAKRAIVENDERGRTDLMRECDLYSWEVRVLGSIYANHPDYREAWRA